MKKFSLILIMCFVLFMLNAKHVTYYETDALTSSLISDICQDKDGFIWIGTEYGLNKFDGIRYTKYIHDESDST